MKRIIYTLTILALFFSCKKEDKTNAENQVFWYDNIGSRTDLPFLPDSAANYFSFSFNRKKGEKIGIRFKSKFMYARYQSYNVYDIKTRSSLASIADKDINALTDNLNPFQVLTQPSNREYVVNLMPDILEAQGYENKLLYNDNITDVSVLLRNYLPEMDVYGDVSLPEIEAFDILTDKLVAMPIPLSLDFSSFNNIIDNLSKIIDLTYLLQNKNEIHTFRFAGLGLFPNLDNQYLLSPIQLANNQVAILKFIPPTFTKNLSDINSTDVRYFSLGIGDSKTYNYKTLSDYNFKISSDGYIYVVIGRSEPDIIAKSEGLNFIEWVPELKNKGILVYRNLLTSSSYPYNMNKVPDLLQNINKVFDTEYLYGDTYLGDRAPTGIKMSKEDFLEDFGGFDIVY
jgi:hypothetical protein